MNPYFEQTILNADPMDLIRMLYQRAISCVRDAREHLQHKRIAERSKAIMRAYAALGELLAALRPEHAPELSGRLQSLYFYMQQRLLDANMRQSDEPLAEVLRLLSTLDEAWSGVAAQLAPKKETGAIEELPREADAHRWRQTGQGKESTARVAVSA
jgi:flagellar protein FliS